MDIYVLPMLLKVSSEPRELALLDNQLHSGATFLPTNIAQHCLLFYLKSLSALTMILVMKRLNQ